MSDSEPFSDLSERGSSAAAGGGENIIWDVINDLYDRDHNPDGYLSLGVAENALMHSELAEYIQKSINVPLQALTYGDGVTGSKRLRAAMSRFLNRHLKPTVPIKPEHISVTNGVSTAVEHCAWGLANPGEAFLLGQPHYGAFISDISLRPNVEVVKVKFGPNDPCGLDCISSYEQALLASEEQGVKVRGLMLCSPHNPLGRCYSREVLIGLLKLCQKYQIHLVSDEVYALSVWENKEDGQPPPCDFTSVLSIDIKSIIDPNLVHVLWGMSKDFGANGIRVGAIISQSNVPFLKAVRTVSLYSYCSSLTDVAAACILEDDAFTDHYIRTNQARLSESYSVAVQFLRKHHIEYAPGANAAFFLWVNLGKAHLDRHPDMSTLSIKDDDDDVSQPHQRQDKDATQLTKNGVRDITGLLFDKMMQRRLFLASGANFGSEEPGWFRIVFSQPRENLMEGLTRMVAAIES